MLAGAIRRLLGRDRKVAQASPPDVLTASARLASDLRLPADAVRGIIARTCHDLRQLPEAGDADARPIIDRAASDLGKLGQSLPFEEGVMWSYLQKLPDRDFQILCQFRAGMKQGEIAALMNTSIETVRSSLVRTYADLRNRMIGAESE